MFFDRLIAVLNSSTINYTHNANNELTATDTTTYLYDANGNTIQETNPPQADSITKYTYNSSNRLTAVSTLNSQLQTLNSVEYKYDSFGRRISKTINNSASADGLTTYYLYADEGLIGEYDSTGNNIKSYGWIPDSIWGTNPVFTIENNQYYFYHNNHLGAPEKITDINGRVVWSAEYAAFGKAAVNEDPDGDGINFTNNLRLPGQYYDLETGKHYNFNRYYDPETGRYISADPIGFAGNDTNLYRYVWNQPNSGIDPLGLLKLSDVDWNTINDAIKVAHSNPGLGAYMAYLALQGASTQDIYEGAGEGIIYQFKRGYHKCFAICMAKEVGVHALIDVTKGVLTEHPTSIAKIFTKTPENLSKFKVWQKVISARAADILKIGKVLDKAHPLFLAMLVWDAYKCVKECLECPGSHDKLW